MMIVIESKKDNEGKDCLSVSLTVDGAENLHSFTNMVREFNESREAIPGAHKLFIEGEPGHENTCIITDVKVLHEKHPFIVDVYEPKTPVSFLLEWLADPKKEILFYPNRQNDERRKEATAKLAAVSWAIYSPQTVNEACLNTQERYSVLKEALEGLMKAIMKLKYDVYDKDNFYYEKLKDCTVAMEKELEFCIEKMKLMTLITNRDLNCQERVSAMYRKYRGVNEEENKSKLNVTDESNTDTQREAGEGSGESEDNE